MRPVLFLTALCLAASSAIAQDRGSDGKKRLVFPTEAGVPAASPAPKRVAAPEPSELLQRFFEALQADKLDAAYEGLAKNTIVASKAENLEQLKLRTREAIDNFGPVTGYEVVETVEIGKSLSRQTCLSLNEELPLRWRFYFYRTGGQWKIIDLRVDDGIVELFEETSRTRRK
jgi:hypothetical protein